LFDQLIASRLIALNELRQDAEINDAFGSPHTGSISPCSSQRTAALISASVLIERFLGQFAGFVVIAVLRCHGSLLMRFVVPR
jgi:hypothetical protein